MWLKVCCHSQTADLAWHRPWQLLCDRRWKSVSQIQLQLASFNLLLSTTNVYVHSWCVRVQLMCTCTVDVYVHSWCVRAQLMCTCTVDVCVCCAMLWFSLSLSATNRLVNTHDFPVLLAQFIESPPWTRHCNGQLQFQVAVHFDQRSVQVWYSHTDGLRSIGRLGWMIPGILR